MQQRLLDLIAFKSLIKKSTICIIKTSKALKISSFFWRENGDQVAPSVSMKK